jgi:hypothetical protein
MTARRPVSHGGAYDAAGNTPAQIEADIAATRVELGEILGALELRLAPRQLLDRGVGILKDTICAQSNRLSQSLRGQPLALALVGLGIGWLLMSQGSRRRPSHPAGERVGEGGTVADMTSDISPPIDYAYARGKPIVMNKAPAGLDGAGNTLDQSRGRASRLMNRHPLASGAFGFLAGATVALLLPRSAAEERLIGPAGEWLCEEAAGLGREAVERARHVAEHTVDAAAEAVGYAINPGRV